MPVDGDRGAGAADQRERGGAAALPARRDP